ncbi:hypothetical protein [Methyloligella solikamskensis]|uniref:Uncharacterized protein n=1 Tax=Methyloligella solikamskensis TaxID=1177756 RepID=A0ABW3J9L4_9HYPH
MASILQFAPANESKPRRRNEATDQLGEVVIFPGVRIERHEEPDAMPVDAPRKQAQES